MSDDDDPMASAYRRVARVMREETARLAEYEPRGFTDASVHLLDAETEGEVPA